MEQAHAAFKLLVITKADIATPELVTEQLEAAQALHTFDDVLVVCPEDHPDIYLHRASS